MHQRTLNRCIRPGTFSLNPCRPSGLSITNEAITGLGQEAVFALKTAQLREQTSISYRSSLLTNNEPTLILQYSQILFNYWSRDFGDLFGANRRYSPH